MNEITNEVHGGVPLVVVVPANEEPAVLNSEQQVVEIEECEYCGHLPCGCGG